MELLIYHVVHPSCSRRHVQSTIECQGVAQAITSVTVSEEAQMNEMKSGLLMTSIPFQYFSPESLTKRSLLGQHEIFDSRSEED